jgi:hypothetical protein
MSPAEKNWGLEAVKKSSEGLRSSIAESTNVGTLASVTNHPMSPVPRLVAIDRRQILLRSVDVEKLIDEDHSARSLWELVSRLDLTLYHAQIPAVEGRAGREHTDPQLLISLWLYAYSRGISSAREVARQCEFEPGLQCCAVWKRSAIGRCPVSARRTRQHWIICSCRCWACSAPRGDHAGGVTLDRTKIKANAGGNSFRRKEKLEAHLELAREQVRILNAEGEEETTGKRRHGGERRDNGRVGWKRRCVKWSACNKRRSTN